MSQICMNLSACGNFLEPKAALKAPWRTVTHRSCIGGMVLSFITGTFRRLLNATRHSCAGIGYTLRHEQAFRLEAILLIGSIPLACYLADSMIWFVALVGSVLAIMLVEIINTAIEQVCNAITRDFRPEIKVAKDCGSAAVLIMSVIAAAIWACAIWELFASA